MVKIGNCTLGYGRPKIIVPIVGKDQLTVLAQAKRILDTPCDIIEWRIDHYEEDILTCAKKLHELDIPLLVTFRTKEEGGAKSIALEDYKKLLLSLCMSGYCSAIDVEVAGKGSILDEVCACAHENNVCVIGSHHDFDKTPETQDMVNWLVHMWELGVDVSKLAVMPHHVDDVYSLLEATHRASKIVDCPLITMSMADLGKISRIAGQTFGSSATFASLNQASAPGQMDVVEVDKMLKQLDTPAKNIYLIGFMGSGKSTIADVLEIKYGMHRIEMDQAIVDRAGMPIPDIFSTYGEDHFRTLETNLLKEISESSDCVVSCGGGVVLKPENIDIMKASGSIVLLNATPETILERVKDDTNRPLLEGKKNVAAIASMIEDRRPKYEAASDIVVTTDDKDAETIASEILERLQRNVG